MLLALTSVLAFSGCKKEEKVEDEVQYVTLGEYKGIEITKVSDEVTEDEVYARITTILEEHKEFVDVLDRESKDGDLINIDVTGEVGGIVEDGFTSEEFDIELGSGIYVMEGFAEHLLGVEAGEELDFDLTVPDSFSDATLIGQEVSLHVIVNSVKYGMTPELTDELVAEISDLSTVEEYQNYIREQLSEEKISTNQNNQKKELLAAVMKNATILQYPEGAIDKQIAEINDKYKTYATLQNITVEEYIQKYYGDTVEAYAEELVNEELVLNAIQKAEKITVSDSYYKEKLPEFAEKYAAMKAEDFEASYGKDTIKKAMLWDKTIQFLLDNATVTE